MTDRIQSLLVIVAIVVAVAAAVWLVQLPDDPTVALGNSAAAAGMASIVLYGKVQRDRKR